MQLSIDEQKAVIAAFKDPSKTQAQGVRLGGQKFFTLSASERSIYGKKQVCAHLAPHTIRDAKLTNFSRNSPIVPRLLWVICAGMHPYYAFIQLPIGC